MEEKKDPNKQKLQQRIDREKYSRYALHFGGSQAHSRVLNNNRMRDGK